MESAGDGSQMLDQEDRTGMSSPDKPAASTTSPPDKYDGLSTSSFYSSVRSVLPLASSNLRTYSRGIRKPSFQLLSQPQKSWWSQNSPTSSPKSTSVSLLSNLSSPSVLHKPKLPSLMSPKPTPSSSMMHSTEQKSESPQKSGLKRKKSGPFDMFNRKRPRPRPLANLMNGNKENTVVSSSLFNNDTTLKRAGLFPTGGHHQNRDPNEDVDLVQKNDTKNRLKQQPEVKVARTRMPLEQQQHPDVSPVRPKVLPERPQPFQSPAVQPQPRVPTHEIGFPNKGLTCYLNSVLQALLGVPCFVYDLLVMHERLKQCPDFSSCDKLLSLFCQLARVRELGLQDDVSRLLQQLRLAFVKVNSQFEGSQMQDAHEFLITFCSALDDDIKLLQKHLKKPDPMVSPVRNSQSHFSSVFENFAFTIMETRTCDFCKRETQKETRDFVCKLVLAANECDSTYISLPRLLRKTLNCSSEGRCDDCHDEQNVLHHIHERFVSLPNVLILYLPRTTYWTENTVHYQKNRTPVLIPEFLNVSEFVADDVALPMAKVAFSPVKACLPDTPPPTTSLLVSSPNAEQVGADVPFPQRSQTPSEVVECDDSFSTPIKYKNMTPELLSKLSEEESLELAVQRSLRETSRARRRLQLCDVEGAAEDPDLALAISESLKEGAGTQEASASDSSGNHDPEWLAPDSPSSSPQGAGDGRHVYRLSAVVSHIGSSVTVNSGHYVADVLCQQLNRWFRYDDMKVRARELRGILRDTAKDAYLFVYQHHTLPATPSSSSSA